MNKNIEIGKRIKSLRIEQNITQEELGKKLGLNKSTIQRYETGKVQTIKLPILENIAFIFNVNPSFLALKTDDPRYYGEKAGTPGSLIGELKPLTSEPEEDSISTLIQKYNNIEPIKLKRFPLLGEIACGQPILAVEDRESYINADADINADFCLIAKGDSMINARIYEGDLVFIKSMPIVEDGEIAAVIIDDEATLKRVYYDRQHNRLQLVAENPKYPPLIYTNGELDQINILGKAVAFLSENI